ncbi:IS66 family insertion sequence element accessory protein TnpA [Dyadobacter frigoris]|uniref:IS66 family insertion sequence element accessory protein TnpB n=2 Tax=Dyadobacter frigoris TaxID=2576211 RepID=A0A4U6CSL4_9BACT|nr:hypothetical protein [Dyadobacter frigoris]TKT84174.1 hypothetical protein FDK13_35145 [Dyadobacter frigoris]GLU57379.1 hypothetical protein Dfri01_68400 [Dyadobacter frigoris]
MLKVVEKAEEMYRLVSDFESGGYTRQSFADLHGVSVSKLDYWRVRYRNQNTEHSGFVEIGRKSDPVSIEIVYPTGVSIRINADLDPARLRQLVTLL